MRSSYADKMRWFSEIESKNAGLIAAILGKGPWPKLGKNYRLNIKIGRN